MAKAIVLSDATSEIEVLQRKVKDLEQANKNLRLQIANLLTCKDFQILNRSGLDKEWESIAPAFPVYSIIFLDLDGVGALNKQLSYNGVNQKIKRAFNCVRSSEIVGRWFSGDEFVLIVQNRLVGKIVDRLRTNFQKEGITFTYAVAQCDSDVLELCVKPCADAVQKKKSERFIDRSGELISRGPAPARHRGVCIE